MRESQVQQARAVEVKEKEPVLQASVTEGIEEFFSELGEGMLNLHDLAMIR